MKFYHTQIKDCKKKKDLFSTSFFLSSMSVVESQVRV